MAMIHTQTRATDSATPSCQEGNAILTKGNGSLMTPPSCPSPGYLQGNSACVYDLAETLDQLGADWRRLVCVDVRVSMIPQRACVTHSVPGYDKNTSQTIYEDRLAQRQTQIFQVADALQPDVDAGKPVSAGGDFNTSPYGEHDPNLPAFNEMLDPLYEEDGMGDFNEVAVSRKVCDDWGALCGTWKSPNPTKKIDYFFIDKNRWSRVESTTTPARRSDHMVLKAVVSFQ